MASDGWDIATLDTARGASYLSDLEKDVVLELNMVRTDPPKYGSLYIQPFVAQLTPSAPECAQSLKKLSPQSALQPNEGLTHAAKDHCTDIGPKGITGHTGSDGSRMGGRIERYGDWQGTIGENISFGKSTARDIVVQLLIDEGLPTRPHRANIMKDRFAVVGVAAGPHAKFGDCCVQDFAGGYGPKGQAPPRPPPPARPPGRFVPRPAIVTGPQRAERDDSNWNTQELDAAATADWLSGIQKDIILEINKLRSDPPKWVKQYGDHGVGYDRLAGAEPRPLVALKKELCDEKVPTRTQVISIFGRFRNAQDAVKQLVNHHSGDLLYRGALIGVTVTPDPKYGSKLTVALSHPHKGIFRRP